MKSMDTTSLSSNIKPNKIPPPWATDRLLKLRIEKRLSYGEIAALTGIPKPTVYDRLRWFEALIGDPEELKAYESSRGQILSAVEKRLVVDLADDERRAKASLNNVAYAFGQIHTARRLEEGKSTSNLSVHASLVEMVCAGKVEDHGDDDDAIEV